jgi:hypothetical protein
MTEGQLRLLKEVAGGKQVFRKASRSVRELKEFGAGCSLGFITPRSGVQVSPRYHIFPALTATSFGCCLSFVAGLWQAARGLSLTASTASRFARSVPCV